MLGEEVVNEKKIKEFSGNNYTCYNFRKYEDNQPLEVLMDQIHELFNEDTCKTLKEMKKIEPQELMKLCRENEKN